LYPAQAVPDVLYLRAFTFADFDGERWMPLEPDPARVAEVPPGERGRALPDAPELAGALYGNRPYELVLHEAAVGSQASVPLPVEAVSIHAYDGPLLYDNVQHTLSATLIGPGDTLRVTAREIVIPRQELARRLAARLPPALGYAPEYARIPVELREQVIARFQQHESLRMLLYGLGDRRREYGMYAAADYI